MKNREARNIRPPRTKLRKNRKPKLQTRAQRFLPVQTFDFKFFGDHLKNYLTAGAFCFLAGYLFRKGADFDHNVPFLGATLGVLVAVLAIAYGLLNVTQLMIVLIPARKGWGWRVTYSTCMVFACFMLTAIFTQGMEKV